MEGRGRGDLPFQRRRTGTPGVRRGLRALREGHVEHVEEEQDRGDRLGEQVPTARLLTRHDVVALDRPDGQDDRKQGQSHRDLVGDHLGAGPKPAQEGPLVVRGPPTEADAVHAERGSGKDIDDADVEVRADHVDMDALDSQRRRQPEGEARQVKRPAPRDDHEADHGRDHDEAGGEDEKPLLDARGVVVLLEEELEAVGDGLEQPVGANPIRTDTVLHPGGELSLKPDGVRATDQDHVKHQRDDQR